MSLLYFNSVIPYEPSSFPAAFIRIVIAANSAAAGSRLSNFDNSAAREHFLPQAVKIGRVTCKFSLTDSARRALSRRAGTLKILLEACTLKNSAGFRPLRETEAIEWGEAPRGELRMVMISISVLET